MWKFIAGLCYFGMLTIASHQQVQALNAEYLKINKVSPINFGQHEQKHSQNSQEVKEPSAIHVLVNNVGNSKLGKTNPSINASGNRLKKILEDESGNQGLLTGIMRGIMLLYSTVSDLLLHPLLTMVLILMSLGLVLLLLFIALRIRKEAFAFLGPLIGFTLLYLLIYLDLLLIIYEERNITHIFFRLDKDIVLVLLASLISYLAGRYSSRQLFEEKLLP